jgi:hypothetical protein
MPEGRDYLALALDAEDSAAQASVPALAASYRDLASSYLKLASLHARSQECRHLSMIDPLAPIVTTN